MDRFRNPFLKHQLISISLNSTAKFVARLLPTLKEYVAVHKKLPKRIVLGLAALIRFYKGEYNGEKIQLKDDKNILDLFKASWEKYGKHDGTFEKLAEDILGNDHIWGEDLNTIPELTHMVSTHLVAIETEGIIETLKTIESHS